MQKRKLSSIIRGSILALMLVPAATVFAAEATQSCVVVVERDGSNYEVAIPALGKIEFAGDGFTISHEGTVKWFEYKDVDRILIGAEPNAISAIAAEGRLAVWPSPANGFVNVAGAPDGTEIKVFSTTGALVASAVSEDGQATVDLTQAPSGTLIVSVDSRSVKIIKN